MSQTSSASEDEYLDAVRESVFYRNELEFLLARMKKVGALHCDAEDIEAILERGRQGFVEDDNNSRDGRWVGSEKTECGLNPPETPLAEP